MKKPKLTIMLNNDMTMVLEKRYDGSFQAYTVENAKDDIDFSKPSIVNGRIITEEDMLSFLTGGLDFLTDRQKEEIYQEKKMEHLIEDARDYADDLGYEMDEEDYKSIAAIFLYGKQDKSLPENDIWDALIKDYAQMHNIEPQSEELEL